jgi:lysozyme family protein
MGFERIIQFTLRWEGGSHVTHDPDDPGGTTKFGIAQRSHPDVDIESLTEDQAISLYKIDYWDKVAQGNDDDLDMVSFDTSVNCGVHRVLNWLPECGNWEDMIKCRRQHYINVITENPKEVKFKDGWENRVVALEKFMGKV